MFRRNRNIAMIITFLISALVHEYVLIISFNFFFLRYSSRSLVLEVNLWKSESIIWIFFFSFELLFRAEHRDLVIVEHIPEYIHQAVILTFKLSTCVCLFLPSSVYKFFYSYFRTTYCTRWQEYAIHINSLDCISLAFLWCKRYTARI